MNPATNRAFADGLNRRTNRPRRRRADNTGTVASLATRRTLFALLASGLGVVPLKGLFSDVGWLIDVWLTMVLVIGPAALIRLRRPAGALDIWPGIVLLVPWLTLRFAHQHAFAGIIPTFATRHDLSRLLNDLHHTTRSEVAPIHTTVAVRLVICALLGLLAALIDLIAVVGRRGALAGVPLLVVYTVAGAVPRKPVSWLWFAIAAVGYLILLALDAGDDLQSWGRRVHAPGGGRGGTALAVSTQRIAAAAIAAAVVLPLLVPGHPRNLIADAFHGGGSGLGGFGGGGGGSGSITPFVALKGQLDRSKPVKLMTVHMTSGSDSPPYYLRVNILSKYDDDAGWGVDSHGSTDPIESTDFATDPAGGSGGDSVSMEARIKISGLTGNAPVFAVPTSLQGISNDTTWSSQDQLLLGAHMHSGAEFTEQFSQPAPTVAQLDRADSAPGADLRPLLQVPADLPQYARDTVATITQGKAGAYAKARAISDYFADPQNGFTYDLKTKPGDSGSALVDFLQNRVGYCQQYAAAMGIMLRAAGVPSRIVLGYMHPLPDAGGNFTVTTSDAHAWVEAYFAGVGWIPFDPTPSSGLVGGAKSDLQWAPHSHASAPTAPGNAQQSHSRSVVRPPDVTSSSAAAAPSAGSGSGSNALLVWVGAGIVFVLLLALAPAAARAGRRRRRLLAAGRDGDPDGLWAELSDTAVDLGYVWSMARSPRQVVAWLGKDVTTSAHSLQALAVAVEHRRYAAGGPADARRLAGDLREVTDELRSGRSGRTRLRAALWPASLGWGTRGGRRRR